MTNRELVMNMLAELSTKEISESQNPETFGDHIGVARQGGEIADLAGSEKVESLHIAEAIGYRNLDRGDWAERGI